MLTVSAIVWERGAKNCVFCDSPLKDVVPEARLNGQTTWTCHLAKLTIGELNLDIKRWNPPLLWAKFDCGIIWVYSVMFCSWSRVHFLSGFSRQLPLQYINTTMGVISIGHCCSQVEKLELSPLFNRKWDAYLSRPAGLHFHTDVDSPLLLLSLHPLADQRWNKSVFPFHLLKRQCERGLIVIIIIIVCWHQKALLYTWSHIREEIGKAKEMALL